MPREENLTAFLKMLRYGEGTDSEDGYRVMFGGELFNSFDDHPRKFIRKRLGGKLIVSSAAGAYQFLAKTWDECRIALKLKDFSPESQDKAAAFLIKRRKALDDVLAGRFYTAVGKCNREWASLPGSPYGQPTVTWQKALGLYLAAGGVCIEDKPNG